MFDIIRSPHRLDDLNEADDGSQYQNNTGEGDEKIFDLDDRADEVMNYDYGDTDNVSDDTDNADLQITKTSGEVYIYISMHPGDHHMFFIEDILTNRSFFFQPSGSSKSTSIDSRRKRGPGKKLKEGVKYNIDSIKASGEPLSPKNIANKFVRQCGVLVKDQLPISIQEWKELENVQMLLGSMTEQKTIFGNL